MPEKISGYRVLATEPRLIVGFGPRFGNRPYDDTTTFGIEHRTIGGYVGVLFERDEFHRFAEWLSEPDAGPVEMLPRFVRPVNADGAPLYVREVHSTRSQFRLIDLQHRLDVTKRGGEAWDGSLEVSCKWLGSGAGRSATLDDIAAQLITEWAVDVDANGWCGWRSGRVDTSEA